MAFVDWLIAAAYLITVLFVGFYAGSREENEADFLVGGRNVPWLAVLASLIATEVSAALYQFCKSQVLQGVKEYSADIARQRAALPERKTA